MTQGKILVIKLGTGVLTQGSKRLSRSHMLELVRATAHARNVGCKIIFVSSGAIAAGREHLGYPSLPPTVASKQMLAAVGQSRLIRIWEELFAIYDLHIGQMLLTRADLEDRERFLNARDMLHALLENNIIPIINENDAVATAEIKVGDNDNLSALAAILAGADTLLLLTDQEGLYTANPESDQNATLVQTVDTIDDSIRRMAGGTISGLGTGGMMTKIQAAEVAVSAGITVIIASGNRHGVIEAVVSGKAIGTTFKADNNPLKSRKHWLYGTPPAGSLFVDKGAAKALVADKRSLLPKGILRVEGCFSRGEAVRIFAPSGDEIARGAVRYGSEALERIAGKHSSEIEELLGYAYGSVAVHRDDLIMLGGKDYE